MVVNDHDPDCWVSHFQNLLRLTFRQNSLLKLRGDRLRYGDVDIELADHLAALLNVTHH